MDHPSLVCVVFVCRARAGASMHKLRHAAGSRADILQAGAWSSQHQHHPLAEQC